jgi:hypothetical protein
MRKLALLLTIGLFLSATSANATDGTKTATKSHKGKKTAVCTGKCLGHCSATAAKSASGKAGCSDPKCMKNGHCTKAAADKS